MKITYETHYKSKREDGRHTSTMAAFMEKLRNTERALKYPRCTDLASFSEWKEALKEKNHRTVELTGIYRATGAQEATYCVAGWLPG